MRRQYWLGFVLVFGLLFLGSAQTRADEVRLPVDGTPAFDFVLPPGWTHLIDDNGNLRLTRENHSSVMQLSMITGPDVKMSYPDMAAAILKAAGATPYSSSGPGSIAGVTGQQFQSTMTNDSGVHINLLVVLAKLDDEHTVTLATIQPNDIGKDDAAALEHLVAAVKLVGLK